MRQDKMRLKLDLSLDGFALQNLSLSVPNPAGSPSRPGPASVVWPIPAQHGTPAAAAGAAAAEPDPEEEFDIVARGSEWRWEVKSHTSQSVVTLGSCPSTAPSLSDLPLTPIPELLQTPTKRSTPTSTGCAPISPERPSLRASVQSAASRHLSARLPSPLDSGPILTQLAQGERDIGTINNVRCSTIN
jgi:hypothetical protein